MFNISIISKVLYLAMLGGGAVVEKKFNKITKNFKSVNNEVLFKILRLNENSEIGLRFGFKNIMDVDDFKNSMPLTDYSFYDSYIKRMAKGEKNILTSEEVEYFGHTSGTTGSQKLIPSTKTGRKAASKYMALLANKFAYNNFKKYWTYGRGLLLADIIMTSYTEGGIPICSATSGGMKAMRTILPYLYTSPIEVMQIEDKEANMYLHILFALQESNLMFISGVFVSSVLDLFRILEENYKEFISDIRKGKINLKLNLSDNERRRLNKLLKPNAARADFLERELKKGTKGIAPRIWPKLAYILTVTGGNFSIYNDKVNYYTDSLPIYSPGYAATEAMIGVNPYKDKIRYVIVPDTVFYEFIKEEDMKKKNPRVYGIDEIEKDNNYEIVITNYAGLYRYRLGDVIRVTDFYNMAPEVQFLYRKNQALNMIAEKTTEDHLATAMKNTVDKLKLKLIDYTTIPDNSITPGRYTFYFELKNTINYKDLIMIEKTLDLELKKANLAYARARDNRKLSRVKIKLVKSSSFSTMKNSLMGKGISKSQIKIPRVLNNHPKLIKFLEERQL